MMSKDKRQIVFLKYYNSSGTGILTKIIELFSLSTGYKKIITFHISAFYNIAVTFYRGIDVNLHQ